MDKNMSYFRVLGNAEDIRPDEVLPSSLVPGKLGEKIALIWPTLSKRFQDKLLQSLSQIDVAGTSEVLPFGDSILDTKISNEAIARNIKAGNDALLRAREAFIKPGVRLKLGKGVPKYQADPANPDRLIQLLNGKKSLGTMINGKFKAAR